MIKKDVVSRRKTRSTPVLHTKQQPAQTRSRDTYEVILNATGDLLERVGFEQISTNLICKEAGMTPPALYRYFPNKYAILKVLGERLIAEQDAFVGTWMNDGLADNAPEKAIVQTMAVLKGLVDVTMRFPGGIAVNRAIRAVPLLQQLHIASRNAVAQQIYVALEPRFEAASRHRLRTAARLVSELSAAVMEMMIDDPTQETEASLREAAILFVVYFGSLREDLPI